MEFKGTKGKWDTMWDFSKGWDKRCLSIVTDMENDYDIIANVVIYENEEIEQANALLISKAPEMLEMLKDIKDYLGSDVRMKVDKLIKEATEL